MAPTTAPHVPMVMDQTAASAQRAASPMSAVFDQTAASQSSEVPEAWTERDQTAASDNVVAGERLVLPVVVAPVASADVYEVVPAVGSSSNAADAEGAVSPLARAHAVAAAAIAKSLRKLDFEVGIVSLLLARPGRAGLGPTR